MSHTQKRYDRDYVYIRGRAVAHRVAARDWMCGQCESKLVTVWDGGWQTVCSAQRHHSANGFIHRSTLDRRIHVDMLQAGNLQVAERRLGMGLKDRDTAYGVPKRMRLGRIGRVRQGIMVTNSNGRKYPKAVDYFILDPTVDGAEERAQILADVHSAILENAPGQDPDKLTVLPIVFLANNDDIIAPESYKLRKGKAGTIWCAGDGETIQWKLTDDFRVEVSQGARVDTGELVPCPGACEEGRHPWCEECKAEIEINFAIMGYERTGMWMIRTSSMTFRDQFWTQIRLVRAMAERGIVPGLVGMPFLLRRKTERVLSPVGNNGSLASVEMPLTTIEIHPEWFQTVMRRGQNAMLQGPAAERVPALPSGGRVESEYLLDTEEIYPTPRPTAYADADADAVEIHSAAGDTGTASRASGGNGATPEKRPLTAERVREIVRYRAGWVGNEAGEFAVRNVGGEPITEAQTRTLAGLIGKATRREGMAQAMLDKARHQILQYLCEVDSTTRLMKAEATALIGWLALAKDNVYEINAHARTEAERVLQAVAPERTSFLEVPAELEMETVEAPPEADDENLPF